MGTVRQYIDALAFVPHGTLIPELVVVQGTNFPVYGWAFTINTNEQLSVRLKAISYGSGNVTAIIDFLSRTGVTTGNVTWGCALSVLTPGDAQSMLTDALATENTQTTAINGTASGLTRSTVTITNLDSLAADDSVELRLRRTDNSMAGDAIFLGVEIQYSD